MNDSLRRAAERLRAAQGEVQGALDSAERLAADRRDQAFNTARIEFQRSQAIVRNRAAQTVTEHRLRARDIADGLQVGGLHPLDVAEHITIGHLSAPGTHMGVNEEVVTPLLLPFIGRGSIVLRGESQRTRRLVERIVWESLRGTAPGQLDIVGYDPNLTSTLAPFSSLRNVSDESLQVYNRAADFDRALIGLAAGVQRVNDTLRGASPDLIDFRRAAGHPVERYKLVVLLDYPAGVDETMHRQVTAIAKAGASAGVSFLIAAPPNHAGLPDWWKDEDLADLGATLREQAGDFKWDAHPIFKVTPFEDEPLGVAKLVDELVVRSSKLATPDLPFAQVQPLEPTWANSSADRLEFAVGLDGTEIAEIVLGDDHDQRHNVLVTGAVGQGKSNLLKVIIHSLAQRYAPEELELILLDFKEGVTLYPMAPTPGASDFLVQAKVLGLESDRDFGLAVLRHIETEFSRRAKLFRPYGDSLSKYRKALPDVVMPRIVVVIDEFHMLFDPNDKTAEAAAQLLEAIARRGRSYGVHLILASQTISGISALMTREGGIFAQFPIRIALKNSIQESYAALGQGNDGASRLRSRGLAILNLDYGHLESNRQINIASADDNQLAALRRDWWEVARDRVTPPTVFDGSRRIRIDEATPTLRSLRADALVAAGPARALLGYPIDVSNQPLAIELSAAPGRNIAILGSGEDGGQPSTAEEPVHTAIGTLQAAAISLALQHPAGDAAFVSLEALDERTFERTGHRPWIKLMALLGYEVERVTRDELPMFLQDLAASLESRPSNAAPKYLLGFGLDRATALDTPDMFAHRPAEDLQQLLRSGPSKRIHTIGWWGNAATFRSHVGFGGEGFVDTMLMLRLDQSSVQELLSSPFISWSVRDNRGLLSDRTQLSEPTTIVPFSPLTARAASAVANTDWEA